MGNGFAESWIRIGRRAVRKMRIRTVVRIFPYPDRFPVCQFDRLEFETFLHVYIRSLCEVKVSLDHF